MVEHEQIYPSIILRLLVDGELDPAQQAQIVWGDLLHVAAQNGVLIRVVDQLETLGLEPRHFFSAAVKEMRARNQRKLALIARLSERCLEANVEFIFPKAFQNYPDMPGDIDLFLSRRTPSLDAIILGGLPARPLKRHLRNRIDGTANYVIRGCESALEIHHGRVGMLGEHTWYTSQIIENGKYFRVETDEFLMPSAEDQLILQGLQRLVQRSYLRLSDVICTINLLRRNALNWNYIFRTVSDLNIGFGLTCYLRFVEQIHRETFHTSIVPPRVLRTMRRRKYERIEFRDGFYRFRRLKVGSRGYINKFLSALINENWSVASRLSLLPVLALTTAVRKLRTSS